MVGRLLSCQGHGTDKHMIDRCACMVRNWGLLIDSCEIVLLMMCVCLVRELGVSAG